MTFREALLILGECELFILHDPHFGDTEFHWEKNGQVVAEGYRGSDGTGISFADVPVRFIGAEANAMIHFYKKRRFELN